MPGDLPCLPVIARVEKRQAAASLATGNIHSHPKAAEQLHHGDPHLGKEEGGEAGHHQRRMDWLRHYTLSVRKCDLSLAFEHVVSRVQVVMGTRRPVGRITIDYYAKNKGLVRRIKIL